jgi:hypothetical protein
MKKLAALLTAVLLLALFPHPSSAELRNGSFEDWPDWMGVDPNWWTSYDDYYAGLDAVAISNDAYHGEIAAKLEVLYSDYYGIFPPFLYSFEDGGGHPISRRYDYAAGYYKFFPQADGDSLHVIVEMLIAYTPIGVGHIALGPASTYTRFICPILYPGSEIPNNVTVTFTIEGPTYGETTIGSWGLVDSIMIGPVSTSVEPMTSSRPESFSLSQNYPNPFNPVTRIDYALPAAVDARLEIYNVRGQLVRNLVNDRIEAGAHFVHWDSKDRYGQPVAPGIYFYRLQAGEQMITKKMLLIK